MLRKRSPVPIRPNRAQGAGGCKVGEPASCRYSRCRELRGWPFTQVPLSAVLIFLFLSGEEQVQDQVAPSTVVAESTLALIRDLSKPQRMPDEAALPA